MACKKITCNCLLPQLPVLQSFHNDVCVSRIESNQTGWIYVMSLAPVCPAASTLRSRRKGCFRIPPFKNAQFDPGWSARKFCPCPQQRWGHGTHPLPKRSAPPERILVLTGESAALPSNKRSLQASTVTIPSPAWLWHLLAITHFQSFQLWKRSPKFLHCEFWGQLPPFYRQLGVTTSVKIRLSVLVSPLPKSLPVCSPRTEIPQEHVRHFLWPVQLPHYISFIHNSTLHNPLIDSFGVNAFPFQVSQRV